MDGHSFEAFQQPATHPAQVLQQELKQHLNTRLGQCMASTKPGDLNCMKLAHYLSIYSELFTRFLSNPVKILEIGVQHGGSLQLWENYFGPGLLQWTGIDINPQCETLNQVQNNQRHRVFIGSQDDPRFLSDVAQKRGPFDIIIDDGSHLSAHIITSFESLLPHVVDDGLYIIEDVHATYWNGFRAANPTSNAMPYFLRLTHQLNSEAVLHTRSADDLLEEEKVGDSSAASRIKKIEFHPSLIICHVAHRGPLIEWKAGRKTILK
jgi:cephalosporin hydroxylase